MDHRISVVGWLTEVEAKLQAESRVREDAGGIVFEYGGDEGDGGRRGSASFLRFVEAADLVDEFSDVAKFFVNAGEADVGDLVNVAEALHDSVAEGV